MMEQASCAESSTGKLSFSIDATGQENGGNLYTISSSGGTPTLIYQSGAAGPLQDTTSRPYRYLAFGQSWSPDDSKIAFNLHTGATGPHAGWPTVRDTIFVAELSSGSITDTIALQPGYASAGAEWSRSGSNVIAYEIDSAGQNRQLYYYNQTSKTTSTGYAGGTRPTWSPNNSSLALSVGPAPPYYYYKTAAFSTTASDIATAPANFLFGNGINWKR